MITAPFAKHCMNRSVHLNDFNDGPWAKDIITPHFQTQHLKGPTCVLLIACVCVCVRMCVGGMSECDHHYLLITGESASMCFIILKVEKSVSSDCL